MKTSRKPFLERLVGSNADAFRELVECACSFSRVRVPDEVAFERGADASFRLEVVKHHVRGRGRSAINALTSRRVFRICPSTTWRTACLRLVECLGREDRGLARDPIAGARVLMFAWAVRPAPPLDSLDVVADWLEENGHRERLEALRDLRDVSGTKEAERSFALP